MRVDRPVKKRFPRREERQQRRRARTPGVLLKELGNLPNMLTLARIAVIPLFVWCTYDADPWYSMWAAAIFAAAAVTDVVDGFLARRWNLVTVMGKFLDPLADKLIVTAALVMMVRLGRVAAWVVIVLLAREFIVTGLRTIAANEGIVIAAGQEGKWKTSMQLVAIICLCIHYTHPLWLGGWTFQVVYNVVGKALLYMSTVLSVWSAGGYFKGFVDTLARRGSAQAG